MKRRVLVVLALLLCIWVVTAAAQDDQAAAMSHVREVMASVDKTSTEELATMIGNNEDFVLLDIRTTDQIRAEGRIDAPQQLAIDRGSLEMEIFRHVVDKDKPVVAYCGAGFRSALAVKTLQDMGFTNVSNYEDGYFAWERSGRPTVKE